MTPPRPRNIERALAGFAIAAALTACAARPAQEPVAAPTPEARCAALANVRLADGAATVADAALDAADGATPGYCVAHVQFADSALRIEMRLPASGWNRKLAFIGGGGFDGRFTSPREPYISESMRTAGYATAATNGGHDYPGTPDLGYFQAQFAYDAKMLADFTFQSEHRALPVAKALVAHWSGAPPERSYFEGCSMGGHDALILAQRYPDDFDGIVARAPAGNIMGLLLQFHRIARLARTPGSALDPAQQALLAKSVLAQCDALDGLADGLIARPDACRFDARTLRCAGGAVAGPTCLGDAQIAFVGAVTSPFATRDGAWTHPGYEHGGEDQPKGWGDYVWPMPALGGATLQGLFSDGFVRSFVTRDPAFDTATFEPGAWTASLSLVGSLFNAADPDLRPLRASGAKLILFNGTIDTSVSSRDTVRYHQQATAALGAGAADTVELFLAPGAGHCFGGPGPDQIDLLAPLARWVETGVAPSAQALALLKRDAAGATTLSRPLCPFPSYARYRGTGDPNDAASFECATP